MSSEKPQLSHSTDSPCPSNSKRIDPQELLVAADLLESNGFCDSAELLRNAYDDLPRSHLHSQVMSSCVHEFDAETHICVECGMNQRAVQQPRQAVLPFFSVGRIALSLAATLNGKAQRQSQELVERLEQWLVENGVTESNAGRFTLEQVNRPNSTQLIYLLRQPNWALVSEISIEKPICGY